MNDLNEQWYDRAEQTPNVFRPPTIAPQGEDGVGHFNYYDRDRALSFQWNGLYEQHVTVSHGGYGEPVKWTFDFLSTWHIGVSPLISLPRVDDMRTAALQFQSTCMKWIAEQERAT